jgi:hypothetical protein
VIGTVGSSVVVNDGAGQDTLSTIEQITTGTGNDSLAVVAGGTNVTLLMRDGDDTFSQLVDAGAQSVDGGTGDNTAIFNDANAENININGATITAPGTGGTDTLSNFQNLLLGGQNDTVTVTAAGTTSLVNMGAGSDTVNANVDAATSYIGGAGADVANAFNYTTATDITATIGATTTLGASTIDNFNTLFIGNGDNTITFNAGSDVTTLNLGTGNDTLTVNSDTLSTFGTGDGNDSLVITQMATSNVISGGNGIDSLQYGGALSGLTAALGFFDIVTDGTTSDIVGGIEVLTLTGGADTINASATAGLTLVDAGGGADVINANATEATTTIAGGAGNDTFNVGGANGNTLLGDAGDDVYIVTLGATAQTFNAGANTAIGDLADYSSNAAVMTVTVNAATTTITGAFGNQTLTNFENLIATNGADTLTVVNDGGIDSVNLNGGDDSLVVQADAGANTFDGAAGTDTADYSAITGDLSIVLQANTVVGTDTLNNFEGLVLGNANYDVTNNAGSPFTSFTTGTGNDTYTINNDGLATVNAGGGTDSIQVNSMTANSTFNLDAGTDSLTYNTGATALTVALGANTVTNGVTTDTFTGLEVLTLANGNDTINAGASSGIIVNAGSGTDSFNVSGSNADTLNGDAGNDTYTVTYNGTVARNFNAGANTDLADYSASASNFTGTVNATAVVLQVGAASTDTATNFETLLLGTGADTITVTNDGGIDSINFGTGNDSLVVNNNATANTYNGAAGTDTANYSGIAGNLTITLQANTTIGADTLIDFEDLVLGNANYDITNNAGSPFTSFTTGTGNDTFTINSDTLGTITTGGGTDSIQVNAMTNDSTFNFGLGVDSLGYNNSLGVLTVALGANTVTDGVTTDTFTGLEVLNLGSNADVINAGASSGITVNAGGGADSFDVASTSGATLNGDAGNDTYVVAYNGATARAFNAGANTDLADYGANAGNFTGTVNATAVVLQVGAGLADTATNFEELLLGSGADTITVANDGGIDSINFGGGNDSLIVQADAGNNTFDGDGGTDTANYSAIVGNLAITLQANTVIGTDTLINFEGLVLGNADYDVTVTRATPSPALRQGRAMTATLSIATRLAQLRRARVTTALM